MTDVPVGDLPVRRGDHESSAEAEPPELLNALLTLLNERRHTSGGVVMKCPLLSCFGASNEVSSDETLTAIFDRFLLRIRSDNLDAHHFQDLLTKGVQHEIMALTDAPIQPLASAREIEELHRAFAQLVEQAREGFRPRMAGRSTGSP